MKVAISANGTDLNAMIEERFGRSRRYLIVDTDSLQWEVLENHNADLSTGAGIQSASMLADAGVRAVLTGNCGPKAMQVFASAGIQVVTGQHGFIRDAVNRLKAEGLPSQNAPSTATATQTAPPSINEDGMFTGGRGGGRCGGRGMGGGMGMGGGRGMGRRCGGSSGGGGMTPGTGPLRSGEVAALKEEAAELQQQMEAIQSRLKQLEHQE
jgi:predicted Fe-Mo cluster-binding NifX family protein